jgi:hypothetical protein
MTGEPEAVTSDEQRELTKRAAKLATERDREAIDAAVARIRAELTTLASSVSDRRLGSHLRAMQRQTSRLAELARKAS